MAKKKQNQKTTPKVNPELEGFDIRIDRFGEIKTNYNIDKINEFLNKNVDDKKLRDRDDIDKPREISLDDQYEEKELNEEEDLIENQIEDMVEGEINEDELEDDLVLDEDFRNEEDFDDFSIEEDDDDDK